MNAMLDFMESSHSYAEKLETTFSIRLLGLILTLAAEVVDANCEGNGARTSSVTAQQGGLLRFQPDQAGFGRGKFAQRAGRGLAPSQLCYGGELAVCHVYRATLGSMISGVLGRHCLAMLLMLTVCF